MKKIILTSILAMSVIGTAIAEDIAAPILTSQTYVDEGLKTRQKKLGGTGNAGKVVITGTNLGDVTYSSGTQNQVLKMNAEGTEITWATDNNTTYTNMAQTEATAGTATTARTISAAVLNKTIDDKVAAAAVPTATSTVAGKVKLGSDTVQTVAPAAVSTTASRTYAVQNNASGQMVVNVPWSNSQNIRIFSTSTAYAVGDQVSYSNVLYEFTAAHAAGAWNAAQVKKISPVNVTSTNTGTGTVVKSISVENNVITPTMGTIATADIADNAVTSAKIAANTIVAADIATGAITTTGILDGTIAEADLSTAVQDKLNAADTDTATSLATGTTATATANAVTTNTNTYLNTVHKGAVVASRQITGSGSVTVAADATGKLTISGTNTTYTGMTDAVVKTGTSTTNQLVSAKVLADNFAKKTDVPSDCGAGKMPYRDSTGWKCAATIDTFVDLGD